MHVRRAAPGDAPALLHIWLKASRVGHSFLGEETLQEQLPKLKDVYIPHADNWVAVEGNAIVGFIGMVETTSAAYSWRLWRIGAASAGFSWTIRPSGSANSPSRCMSKTDPPAPSTAAAGSIQSVVRSKMMKDGRFRSFG
jgi:hypothetical protein